MPARARAPGARDALRCRELRVLVVSDYYPPFIGGAQIQTQLLARRLSGHGHTVAVATAWQNDLATLEHDDGIEIHRLRQLRTLPILARRRFQHHQPPFPDPVTVWELRRLVRRFKPDIIHSYGWISFSVAAALLGLRIPLLITARDYGYACAKRTLMFDGNDCSGPGLAKCVGCAGSYYGRPKGWIAAVGVLCSRRLLRAKTRGIHSVSTYVRDMVRRDFLDDRSRDISGLVIHDVIGSVAQDDPDANPVDAEPADAHTILAQLPAEPYMLFVGAFRRVKGIEELLAAYAQLRSPPPLVLLGTIEPDSPTTFPEGVCVITNVPHASVLAAARSRRCLFGVMPSLLPEPFGTVVCEVMSQGKPVIGTSPGGHQDMIDDGINGFLVPRGDVAALAAAMQVLVDDGALRERLGLAAGMKARQFTAAVALPRLERLYETIVDSQAAPSASA